MDLKKWWPLIVGVILSVAALSATLYGVFSHSEAGFSDEPPWQPADFPLVVVTLDYATVARLEDENVAHAMGTINERVGLTLFRAQSDDSDRGLWDVEITLNSPLDVTSGEDPGGFSRFEERGDRMVCVVRAANTTGPRLAYVIQHELGECLGLGHDDFEASIMAPIQRYDPLEEEPLGSWPARLTDSDVALLRRTYYVPSE